MEDKGGKYLENLANKVMKEASVESPSFNFTESVMQEVNILSQSKTIAYEPLISKRSWVMIFTAFVGLLIYSIFFNFQPEASTSQNWFSALDFNLLSNNRASNLISGFSVPKVFAYALILFGGMICVQVPFLKYHFNKRLEI